MRKLKLIKFVPVFKMFIMYLHFFETDNYSSFFDQYIILATYLLINTYDVYQLE